MSADPQLLAAAEAARHVRLTLAVGLEGSKLAETLVPKLETVEAALQAAIGPDLPPVPPVEAYEDRPAPGAVKPFEALAFSDYQDGNSTPQAVQGLFYGLTVLAGAPNAGKSALKVDALAHIAANLPFFGRKVSGGPVLDFACEAPYSNVQRVRATMREKFGGRRRPYYIVREVPALCDEVTGAIALERVIATIEQVASLEGERVRLVAFDTVAALLAGADENGDGMQRLVAAVQAIIERTGVSVVLLHHPSKADPAGLRGHGCLAGAADVIVRVEVDEPSGIRRAIIVKSRDGQTGGEHSFRLDAIQQPDPDAFGDPQTTVVVAPADPPPRQVRAAGKLQQAAVVALREFARSHPDTPVIPSFDMGGLLKVAGIGRQRRPEILNWLVNTGVLTPSVGGHTLNREALP